jgi:hypothetical protein
MSSRAQKAEIPRNGWPSSTKASRVLPEVAQRTPPPTTTACPDGLVSKEQKQLLARRRSVTMVRHRSRTRSAMSCAASSCSVGATWL